MINIEEMRKFARYPSEIPIQCQTAQGQPVENPRMQNVSGDGLCFTASTKIDPNNELRITFPLDGKAIHIKGKVAWCMDMDSHYELGVSIDLDSEETDALCFDILCDIEYYRQQVQEKDGRKLSSDEAAAEWITKFKHRLPT
jgi:hypothetical protein